MKRRLSAVSQRRYAAVKRVFCPHCCQRVQQKTYQEHKRLFFDESNNSWQPAHSANPATYPQSSSDSSDESQCPEPSSTEELEEDQDLYEQVSSPSSMDGETVTCSIGDSAPGQASLGAAETMNTDPENL